MKRGPQTQEHIRKRIEARRRNGTLGHSPEAKERLRAIKKKGLGVAGFNSLLCAYRRNAKERGHAFSLTEDECRLLFKSECEYCGQPPAQIRRTSGNDIYIYNGIDRVDNERGYTTQNSVSCCKTCNRAKSALPKIDFLAWVKRLVAHQTKSAHRPHLITPESQMGLRFIQ